MEDKREYIVGTIAMIIGLIIILITKLYGI